MLTHSKYASTGRKIFSLLLGPAAGLTYVIFLPFISIAATTFLIGRKVLGKVWSFSENLVYLGWRPSEAYLWVGKKTRK
jgi:hypothetical protein